MPHCSFINLKLKRTKKREFSAPIIKCHYIEYTVVFFLLI